MSSVRWTGRSGHVNPTPDGCEYMQGRTVDASGEIWKHVRMRKVMSGDSTETLGEEKPAGARLSGGAGIRKTR